MKRCSQGRINHSSRFHPCSIFFANLQRYYWRLSNFVHLADIGRLRYQHPCPFATRMFFISSRLSLRASCFLLEYVGSLSHCDEWQVWLFILNVYLHIPLPSLALRTDRVGLPCNHTQRLFGSCCIVCHLDFGDDIGRVLTTVLLYRKVSEPWGWKYHYTFQHIFSKTFAALLTKTFLVSGGWKNIPKYLQLFSLLIHTSKQYKNT